MEDLKKKVNELTKKKIGGKKMKVSQFYNKNQFVIEDIEQDKIIFQSYSSTIAIRNNTTREITIGGHWDHSATTLRHFYAFLKENIYFLWYEIKDKANKKQAFQKLIDNGFNGLDSVYKISYKENMTI